MAYCPVFPASVGKAGEMRSLTISFCCNWSKHVPDTAQKTSCDAALLEQRLSSSSIPVAPICVSDGTTKKGGPKDPVLRTERKTTFHMRTSSRNQRPDFWTLPQNLHTLEIIPPYCSGQV